MTHPIPGADSENDDTPISMSTYGSKEECEAEHARRAAAKVGANVAADENLALVIARLEQIAGNFSDTPRELAEEALVCARCLAAGAPAETPKQSHAEWVLRQISQLAPHQGATAIFMATEGLAAQPAPAATYCDSINNFLSETLEIPEKQTAFRDRFSKWLNLGCPLPDATPIAGDVEKYAWTTWELCQACVKTGFGPLEAQTLLNNLEATRAAMLANSSSGEAG